ncbi:MULTISPECIES: RES domain-containing protein [unclassified Flavobacterium]|jgi:hypothetical protein|uniref:RES domain-containing protein n=1 Tax=unclassified Flavobacterium TaxID=196869 RepID=UPI0025C5AC25|nr:MULTISPECIES: RES domain-containing protein [unclassified Flavobacterium]
MSNIDHIIKKIEAVDLKDEKAIEILENILSSNINKLPIFLTSFAVGKSLIRTRFLSDKEDFHHSIADFSYNPNPMYVKIGRVNYCEQQIFYGSRFRATSLGEIRFIYANKVNNKARFSIGKWEVKRKLRLAAIISPELINHHNAEELFGLAEFIKETEEKFINKEEFKEYIEIYKYIAKKFTEPIQENEEYKYKITAVFSNFIFSKFKDIDGIIYQSVQYPVHFNIALKKNVIDLNQIQLTNASKQTFAIENKIHFKEQETIEASKIDYVTNLINW